ncbi:MAG: hypothetical protein U5L96_16990 [Owenweeksia sp.]|nr:hypothetical protein [Owenweeksia sp.]
MRKSHLKNIGLSGHYRYEKNHDQLVIQNFSGKGASGSFAGALKISNLERPAVTLDLKSDLTLNEWLLFLPLDTLTDPTGRARVNIRLKTVLNHCITSNPLN